jgi:predicted amidohydrolase YtcJ
VIARLSAWGERAGIEVVEGRQFDDSLVEDDRHLTRHDLDGVSETRPVVVSHISGHLAYANSVAQRAAGVSKDTPDPEGGLIARDENGEPTGVLYESATRLVLALAPPPTLDEAIDALEWAGRQLVRVGVTSMHDVGSGQHELSFRAYDLATRDGRLPVRTYLAAGFGGLAARYGPLEVVPTLASTGLASGFGSDRVRAGILKIVHDGSLQGHSGAVTVGYHDQPETTGIQIWPQETLNTAVEQALVAGWQVGIHGNGDQAIDSILDASEGTLAKHPVDDHRLRIEHCQTVREDQLDRMARLGVAASFFNLHVYYWGQRHRDRFLGPERGERISPLRSALARGIHFGGHSDWWVTPVDPLFNVHVAVNRRTREGDKLGPDFTITPEQALHAMTLDSAWLGFEERLKGSIEVGKLGDLVVLSDDPLTVPPEAIDDLEVDYTVIGGEVVYHRSLEGGSRRDERMARDPRRPEAFTTA